MAFSLAFPLINEVLAVHNHQHWCCSLMYYKVYVFDADVCFCTIGMIQSSSSLRPPITMYVIRTTYHENAVCGTVEKLLAK